MLFYSYRFYFRQLKRKLYSSHLSFIFCLTVSNIVALLCILNVKMKIVSLKDNCDFHFVTFHNFTIFSIGNPSPPPPPAHWISRLYRIPLLQLDCIQLYFLQPLQGSIEAKFNMSRHMTNPTKWLCAQRRLKSVWASAQSNQSLRCPHEESLGL